MTIEVLNESGRELDVRRTQRLAGFVTNWPAAREQVGIDIAVADVRYQRGFALTPAAAPQDGKQVR